MKIFFSSPLLRSSLQLPLTAEPLSCPCGPSRHDPWHPACCPDPSKVVEATANAVIANRNTAKPHDCPCGPGKRDPWHPVCCPDPSTVVPKVV
ncbi:hypothetical protein BGZ49_004444 [Haplosporangium sp. Z 27]|nr:hypothetical protein BGZ49_004444 [Haplosporangium sp. Z 27]